MTKRLSLGYPYYLVKSSRGRGGWGWGLLCFWRLFEKIKDCRHLPFFCVHACCRSSRVAFSRVLAHFPPSTITEGNKVFLIRSSVHPFKGIRIPESGKFLLSNPESFVLESGKHSKDSGIPPTIGIRNSSSTAGIQSV